MPICSAPASARSSHAWDWTDGRGIWRPSSSNWSRWPRARQKSARRARANFKRWTGHAPKAFAGPKPWLDILRDFPDLDVMAVATPDPLHAEVILAALKAGAHVLTEKPMCLDIAEADRIIALAKAKKRIVAVDMHKRYDPDHLRIREEIKQRIGEPLYGMAYLEEPLHVSTRTFKWVEQSDPFSYVGTHWVDLIYHYYRSKPVSLTAVGQKKRLARDGINAYDAVQVRVDFDNGMSISFHNNWITPPDFEGAGEPGPRNRRRGRQGGERPAIPRLALVEPGRRQPHGEHSFHARREAPGRLAGLRRLRGGQPHGGAGGDLPDEVLWRDPRERGGPLPDGRGGADHGGHRPRRARGARFEFQVSARRQRRARHRALRQDGITIVDPFGASEGKVFRRIYRKPLYTTALVEAQALYRFAGAGCLSVGGAHIEFLQAMNGETEHSAERGEALEAAVEGLPGASEHEPFFQRADWLSGGLTTALALAVYWVTLAPEVTLEFSGIFSVGAMYAGVPYPPGYPLWTIYAWLFTWLLPCSNIAWRVAVSSAVAGALTCGVIALMASRGAGNMLEGVSGLKRLAPKAERALRVMCGCVAGLAFGLDSAFWCKAVVVEVWPLTMLLFATVLCLLMRWMHAPERRRWLYAAALVYGLTLTNSQALAVAGPGLVFVILLGAPALGRDLFCAATLLLGALLLAHGLDLLPEPLASERNTARCGGSISSPKSFCSCCASDWG